MFMRVIFINFYEKHKKNKVPFNQINKIHKNTLD